MNEIWFWVIDYILGVVSIGGMIVIYFLQKRHEKRMEELLEKTLPKG